MPAHTMFTSFHFCPQLSFLFPLVSISYEAELCSLRRSTNVCGLSRNIFQSGKLVSASGSLRRGGDSHPLIFARTLDAATASEIHFMFSLKAPLGFESRNVRRNAVCHTSLHITYSMTCYSTCCMFTCAKTELTGC